MTASAEPTALLSGLYRADGSATFSQNGYTVVGSVNGPIEVQRRDELPEEAAVDVVVRPAAGVGGTQERCLESIIQSTLRQITNTPKDEHTKIKLNQPSLNLPILTVLLQTAVLALLSASMPLATTLTATLVSVNGDGASSKIIISPTLPEIRLATSVHVLAFTSHRRLLMTESEGSFTMQEWDEVFDAARDACCGTENTADGDEMVDDDDPEEEGSMTGFLRSALQEKATSELQWRG